MNTLTVPEVAEQLRMSKRYVRRQLESKALRGVKLGNKWRITQAAVDQFLDPDRVATTGPKPLTARQKRRPS